MDLVERAKAMAVKSREDEAARDARRAIAAAENRVRYPKFTAFVDSIRAFDPEAKVTRINKEFCE